eukprot:5998214-Pyramimonas_sp.AAC.1
MTDPVDLALKPLWCLSLSCPASTQPAQRSPRSHSCPVATRRAERSAVQRRELTLSVSPELRMAVPSARTTSRQVAASWTLAQPLL